MGHPVCNCSYLQCPVTFDGHSMQLWRTLLMRWSRFCVGKGVDPITSSYRMHPRDHWMEGRGFQCWLLTIYRVVNLVAEHFLFKSNSKFHHSMNFLSLSATLFEMSTKVWP